MEIVLLRVIYSPGVLQNPMDVFRTNASARAEGTAKGSVAYILHLIHYFISNNFSCIQSGLL